MEKEALKERIIRESMKLFLQYGVRSVTMDDIAKHLGISKKTIYQNFKDKEEIIFLATQSHFDEHLRIMEEIERISDNPVEQLYRLSIALREQMKKVSIGVLYDLKKYYKDAWANYQKFKYEIIYQSVLDNLKKGIEEGLFRDDINPEILANLRIGEIELSFNKEYFPEDKFTLGEIHHQFFTHYTYGILSEKGFRLFEEYQKKGSLNEN